LEGRCRSDARIENFQLNIHSGRDRPLGFVHSFASGGTSFHRGSQEVLKSIKERQRVSTISGFQIMAAICGLSQKTCLYNRSEVPVWIIRRGGLLIVAKFFCFSATPPAARIGLTKRAATFTSYSPHLAADNSDHRRLGYSSK